MNTQPHRVRAFRLFALAVAGLVASLATCASAQSSSLFGRPDGRRELALASDSWTFQKPLEPVPIQLHDIITVVVNEQSVVISEGLMDRKKKAHNDFTLKDWIFLKGLSVFPNPMTSGDPRVRGEVDNKYRADAMFEARDSMKFRMACTVVDVRPNGNLVLEGRRQIKNNEDAWEYCLTGEIRARDVLPNNTIQSENVANLQLNKREVGHVRDAYRRGWLTELIDHYQPF